jgi:import inner membrane translocase subunit TIM54
MPLPFGLKAPSKGTLIFSGVAGAISGIIYTSNKNAEESRKRLAQRVSFLADRPCGVHVKTRAF